MEEPLSQSLQSVFFSSSFLYWLSAAFQVACLEPFCWDFDFPLTLEHSTIHLLYRFRSKRFWLSELSGGAKSSPVMITVVVQLVTVIGGLLGGAKPKYELKLSSAVLRLYSRYFAISFGRFCNILYLGSRLAVLIIEALFKSLHSRAIPNEFLHGYICIFKEIG